jgi:HPt (histidine-containing phosphotransfer) domain-containing protein
LGEVLAGPDTLRGPAGADELSFGVAPRNRAPYDRDAALAGLDGDEGLLRQLAVLFVQEAARLLAEMDEALARGDAAALRNAAHTLKGAAYPFVAPATASAAARVEALAGGDPGEVHAAYRTLAREARALRDALAALADSPAGPPAVSSFVEALPTRRLDYRPLLS